MSEMVEVLVDSVRASLTSPQRIVILREANRERYLPVWVGPSEAESISVALQEVEVVRPMTHDLLRNVFGTFEIKLLRVEILSLKADIFYGSLVARQGERTVKIDSRPSDAIALAVRAHVPILVSQEVMNEASIIPERDMEEPKQEGDRAPDAPRPPADPETGRLSLFEDFLKKMDDDKNNSRKEN